MSVPALFNKNFWNDGNFYNFTVQNAEAKKHLKCGHGNWEAKFFILIKFT